MYRLKSLAEISSLIRTWLMWFSSISLQTRMAVLDSAGRGSAASWAKIVEAARANVTAIRVLPARERAGNRIDPHPMAKEKKRGQQPPKDRLAPATSTGPTRMFCKSPSGRADTLPQNDADVSVCWLSNRLPGFGNPMPKGSYRKLPNVTRGALPEVGAGQPVLRRRGAARGS